MIAQRMAVIGLGLIGGSLARAARAAGVVSAIVGFDADPDQRRAAVSLGVVDRAPDTAAEAVEGADLVILAVPVLEITAVLSPLGTALSPDAILTDVGSTKMSVIRSVDAALHGLPSTFVPAHPIAGTEKSGVAASCADLFRDRRVILTPHPGMAASAGERVRRLWEAVGALVEQMTPAHHDAIFAATSHLPHVLAYVLVDLLARMDDGKELFSHAGGGFRDFTRIAGSSPKVWHDIVRANRTALLPLIEQYADDLLDLRDAIRDSDSIRVLNIFERARGARERYLEMIERSASNTPESAP